jgi:hypothetical protein
MGRQPCTFRQRDVSAAIKAVRAAGFEIARVEITTDGRIIVVTGKPENETEINPWDKAAEDLNKR